MPCGSILLLFYSERCAATEGGATVGCAYNPTMPSKADVLKRLQAMPNIGPSIALDLWDLGIRAQADLKGRSAQQMFEEIRDLRGGTMDRCMLYVLRAVVYYAQNEGKVEKEKLAWWNWSDKALD